MNQKLVAKLIEKSRRAAGISALMGQSLVETAQDWAELLSEIPENQLEACYKHAMRTRTAFGALQPAEIVAAWNVLRNGSSQTGLPVYVECEYCGGTGWQITDRGARPCVCDSAPPALRSKRPLCEPDYVCGDYGIWVRVKRESVAA